MSWIPAVCFYFDISRCYPVLIDGHWYQKEDLQGREHLYLETKLTAGTHLIAFDLMAREHWAGVHFALHCDAEFCLEQPAGSLTPDAETPFLLLGPFAPAVVMVDDTPMPEQDLSVHDAAVSQLPKNGIDGFEQYQRPVPLKLVSECDPFLLFANAREYD